MSYALRLTLLASAVFFLNYVSLSLCVAAAWRLVRKRAAWNAGMLYVLRIAPVGVAIGVVGVLVIPSFLYLEPFGTGESFGLPKRCRNQSPFVLLIPFAMLQLRRGQQQNPLALPIPHQKH